MACGIEGAVAKSFHHAWQGWQEMQLQMQLYGMSVEVLQLPSQSLKQTEGLVASRNIYKSPLTRAISPQPLCT
jgi:hypothetical protein